ncbi:FxSxx-COOH system tetratricopeptide repeat protein [Neochlamydia sp. AcF95]|uniref:FxSxx-COOH system tetratricopeptide repeat protein n=1 Tax=Neochlamydia sp. AcF95 TaxID=2795734 RepID=UPI001BC8FEFF|nr:FxSxx-COOH system tetratricopeptide repeat protein [Neochlamydia sp. AcF95]MBS4169509.1 hypothetical protein [Neochlamydia sp. AcF95]
MNIENASLANFVFPMFKEIEKRNLSLSQGPYAEISLQIFAKLRSVDLCRARLVCKEWKQLIQQANLWKGFHQDSDKNSSQKEIKAVSNQLVSLDLLACKWNSSSTAEFLWHDPGTLISGAMLAKVNAVAAYLYTEGYELKGAPGDGDCFFSAFLGSYEGLSRKIPLLDDQKDKISYLRQVLSDSVKHKLTNHTRAAEIIGKGSWISGLGEGDLLASALSIPIRLITVNEKRLICSIHDRIIFSQTYLAEDDRSQEWETIPQEERRQEYIFIVDLGGHFIYAQKTLRQLEMLSDPFRFFSSPNDSLPPLSLDKSFSKVSEIYVGCMITGNQAEKLYLYIKGGFLKGYLYRKEKLIEEISPHQIQGGLHGEIESQALIRLINKIGQRSLFALYHPQATDKKVTLLPAPPMGSYLEEYALSYVEAPLPNINLFCRPNLSKALDKGLKKFGLVSLVSEEGICCPTGKTELAKAYFYAQRESYNQALWLRGEKEWFIEQGLKEFSQKIGLGWQEWLGTHNHWLIIIDGLSYISLLRKLGLIELAQKKQGKLMVTTRDKVHDSAIHQIPVGLLSREESKNYLLQVTHYQDEHSVDEAEKIGEALGGVPSSLKKAADWLNDNAWPLKVYFAKQAANLAEHKAYLEARSNLTPPNEYFTGREADLVALEETLTQGKPLVLAAQVGLGGVGKTQLALQYAYRTAPQYNFIWWLNAASEAALLQSYSDLAEKLHIFLTKEEEKEDKALVKKVHCYLKENPGWLLIFDDAENATTLNSWLPESGGHLLITSRKPNWPNAQVFTLGVFKREESIELILKITHLEDQKEEAGKLADLLQNLPLAVSQAAFYIKETYISIEEYKEKFEQHYKVLWEFEVPPDIYQATVQVTWHVSMQKIRQEEAKEKENNEYPSLVDPLMQFCAYLSSQGIPRRLLKEWVINVYQSETPSLDINHTIDLLRRYSMIEAAAETISIHSLVQLVVRDQLKNEEQKEICGKSLNVFKDLFVYDETNIANVKEKFPFTPHVEKVIEHALHLQVDEHSALSLNMHVARYLMYKGTYKAARNIIEVCIEKSSKDSDRLFNAALKNNLANTLLSLGNFKEAKITYQEAIKLYEEVYSPDHLTLAGLNNNLGATLSALGLYEDAKASYEKALHVYHSNFLKGIEVADTYHNLGNLLKKLGHYDEANEYYKKALELKERVYSAEHPSLADTYNAVGTLFEELGQYSMAKEKYKSALAIQKKAYVSIHPSLADTYNNLGNILQKLGNYSKAKKIFQKTLKIKKAAFSIDHLFLASTYNNIGNVSQQLGEYDEAKNHYEKALEIKEKSFSITHPDLISTLSNKGCALKSLGRYKQAEECYRRALEIQIKVFHNDHSSLAHTKNNLGNVLRMLGQYGEAQQLYQEAQRLYERVYSPDHPFLAEPHHNLGNVLRQLGQYEKAKEHIVKAIKLKKEILFFDHLSLACSYDILASVLQDLAQYEEAKEYYKLARNIFKKVGAKGHPSLAGIYLNLGIAYQKLGNFKKANKNYQEALQINQKAYTETHPLWAPFYINLGGIMLELGRYSEAEKQCHLALAILQINYSEMHPEVAFTYSQLGKVMLELGQAAKAEIYYKDALLIQKKIYSSEHPSLAESYHNLGNALRCLSRYKEAQDSLEEAKRIKKKIYLSSHPSLAHTYNALGKLFHEIGQYEKAKKYHGKTIEIYTKAYSSRHISLADVYRDLGNVEQTTRRHGNALAYFLEALKIQKAVYESDHPELAITYNNLGVVEQDLGRYEEAKTYYEEGLRIQRKVGSPYHPHLASFHHNLGYLSQALNSYEEAKEHYCQSLEIKKKLFPQKNHPSLADTYMNLGGLYANLGQMNKAKSKYEKGIKIYEKVYPEGHPSLVDSYHSLASVLETVGNYTVAKQYYEKVVELKKNKFPAEIPSLAISSHNLGCILHKLGHYEEATLSFKEAIALLEPLISNEHPHLKLMRENLENAQELKDLQEFFNQVKEGKKSAENEEESLKESQLFKLFMYQALQALKQSKVIEAKQKYKEAIRLLISNEFIHSIELAEAYQNLACCYQSQQNFKKAEINLEKASKLNPSTGVLCEMGHFYYTIGEYSKAVEYLLKVISLENSQEQLFYGQLEKSYVALELKIIIEQRGSITVNASVLAYKLLIDSYLKIHELKKAYDTFQAFAKHVHNRLSDCIIEHLFKCSREAIEK